MSFTVKKIKDIIEIHVSLFQLYKGFISEILRKCLLGLT